MKKTNLGNWVFAHGIDGFLFGLFVSVPTFLLLSLEPILGLMWLPMSALTFVGINNGSLLGMHGYTIGKKIAGLKLVKDGKPVGPIMALVRTAIKSVFFFFSGIGAAAYLIILLKSENKQAPPDIVIGAEVVPISD